MAHIWCRRYISKTGLWRTTRRSGSQPTALSIKYAVLAGVDSIEHGSYINDEDIQLMKDHGTYLVPTVYLEDWLMENYKTLGFTTNMIEKKRTW
jgi:hypothetical protein